MQLFLSPAEAARILLVTPAAVRLMVKRAALRVAAKTEGGMHLFRRRDVERLAERRARRRPDAALGHTGSEPPARP